MPYSVSSVVLSPLNTFFLTQMYNSFMESGKILIAKTDIVILTLLLNNIDF